MNNDQSWIKAAASADTGNCIEMRPHTGAVQVRDTKDAGEGPILGFTPSAFASWIGAAKRGEFDRLAASPEA